MLKLLGQPVTQKGITAIRLAIILLCVLGILLLRTDQNSAAEYGNYEELQKQYPELLE